MGNIFTIHLTEDLSPEYMMKKWAQNKVCSGLTPVLVHNQCSGKTAVKTLTPRPESHPASPQSTWPPPQASFPA